MGFHKIDKRLKKPRNNPRISFRVQQRINSVENGNDNHGYQLTFGSTKLPQEKKK